MNDIPNALEITLRKFKLMAPPFHQHIVKNKLMGKPCRIGDRIVVYEVVDTNPSGMVIVTEKTHLHFE